MKKIVLFLTVTIFLVLSSCSIEDTNILSNNQINSELNGSFKRVVVTYKEGAVFVKKQELKNEFIIEQIIKHSDNMEMWLLKPNFDIAVVEEVIAMHSEVEKVSIDDNILIFQASREGNSTGDGKDDDESDNTEERETSGDGKDDDESDNTEERETSGDGKDDDVSDNTEERETSGDGKDDDVSDNTEERETSGDGKDDDESDNGEERDIRRWKR
ncbi:hypothetical protein [Pseudofulvibacter geojedonensis]|uniref:Lipoprotein n=1 Tax=Pseudofulvibacter geojedonensis TaxID=1123758 RepID=A0ABW3HYC4_9FLAO